MQTIKSVVLTVYKPYLDTLVKRADELTTMVYGWQKNPKRMKTPAEILAKEQSLIPFLFSEDKQNAKKITHVSICGWIRHTDDIETNWELMNWLSEHRIEKFCNTPFSDEVKTFYLVSDTKTVVEAMPPANVIPYKMLKVDSTGARLAENKRKGYSIVELPDFLFSWYEDAYQKWQQNIADISIIV